MLRRIFQNLHLSKKSLLCIAVAAFLVAALCTYHPFRILVRVQSQQAIARVYAAPRESFPTIDTAKLTETQKRIITITKQEYAKKPVSYDSNVLTYTQGVKEAWCADFASWVYSQAGLPLKNPNSGSWRIPGVYTMQEYFQAGNRYKAAGNYIPQSGDIAILSRGQGHVAIVLSVSGSAITTIGGNENGRIRISRILLNDTDLLGFGRLAD